MHGLAKRLRAGCVNAADKLRQKRYATAGTKFSKPGQSLLTEPCICKRWRCAEEKVNLLVQLTHIHVIAQDLAEACSLRGHSQMTSAWFLGFFTPLPCQNQIDTTSLPSFCQNLSNPQMPSGAKLHFLFMSAIELQTAAFSWSTLLGLMGLKLCLPQNWGIIVTKRWTCVNLS